MGASASFIGLLFVGLTVVFARNDNGRQLTDYDRLQAQSAYAALVNIFFVTMTGLVPGANIGPACLVLALFGLANSWRMRGRGAWVPLVLSGLIYLYEAAFAVLTLINHGQPIDSGSFQTIMLVLFGLGLFRAWEMTGIRRK